MSKLLLRWHTIRHLKWSQIYYQLYYKVKRYWIPYLSYSKYSKSSLHVVEGIFTSLIVSDGKYLGHGTFCFLNLQHQFENGIDWNFSSYGKLWNYNLQYFDYLHDEAVSEEAKRFLIENFSISLLKKKVPPEAYPVSLRLINWIIYASKTGYTSPNFKNALKYQVNYLENNLEYHILANHILENYFALFIAGYALRDADLTLRTFNRIEKELKEQVLPDGGHYECSPMYHCIILSKLLILVELIKNNTWITIDDEFLRLKAAAMLGWIKTFSFADGSYAHFNDSISGVAPLPARLTEHAEKLGIAIPVVSLKESGYRKFAFEGYEAMVDVGEIIPEYQPGHAHSDMLSFCIQTNTGPLITDVGISTYEKNTTRVFERSTAAHNTVVIGNTSQSGIWSGFRVAHRAGIRIYKDDKYEVNAGHDGYASKYSCWHNRKFLFSDTEVCIYDDVSSDVEIGTSFYYLHWSNPKPYKLNGRYVVDATATFEFINSLKEEMGEYNQPVGYNMTKKGYYLKIQFLKKLITTIHLA